MEPTTELSEVTTAIENDTYSLSEELNDYEDRFIITKVFLELYTVLSLVCIAANLLIVFVIVKYKRLREEKANVILLNWCIVNTFFMAMNPTTLRFNTFFMRNTMFCIAEQLEYNFLTSNIILMVLLTAYWYMKLYHPNKFVKFVQHLRCAIIGVYVFTLFWAGIHIDACYNHRVYVLAHAFLVLTYLAFILFMIVMNIVHAVKKRKLTEYSNKKNVPFILTNTFFVSCLPMWGAIFLAPFVNYIIHVVVVCACLLICVMNPIYFFVILFKVDKDFNAFLKHIFSCRCAKYQEELVEQPVVYKNV